MLSVFLPSFFRSSSVCAVADTAKRRAAAEAASLMVVLPGDAAGNAMLHLRGASVNGPGAASSYVRPMQNRPGRARIRPHAGTASREDPHVVVACRIDGH